MYWNLERQSTNQIAVDGENDEIWVGINGCWTQRNIQTNPSAHEKAVFSGYDQYHFEAAKFSKKQFDAETKKVTQFEEKLALLANLAQSCRRNQEIVDSYCSLTYEKVFHQKPSRNIEKIQRQ